MALHAPFISDSNVKLWWLNCAEDFHLYRRRGCNWLYSESVATLTEF